MPRKLAASDRKSLIRLASSMEKGSSDRRAILAGLKAAFTSKDDVAFEALEKKGKTSAYFGDRRGFEPEELDILAGEIVAYAYEGDGPERGPAGLRYLAQDDGAIWNAAEEAGFESGDPALEYFMELDNRERIKLLSPHHR